MFWNMASNVSENDVYILFVKLSAFLGTIMLRWAKQICLFEILFSFAFVQLDKW